MSSCDRATTNADSVKWVRECNEVEHEGSMFDGSAAESSWPYMDMINSPPHYNHGGMECIDAIKAALSPEEFRGYLKGTVFKYLWRERHKGGNESIKKAEWFLKRIYG